MKKNFKKYVIMFIISFAVVFGYDMVENYNATGNPFIDVIVGEDSQTEQELIDAAETHKTPVGGIVYGNK